MAITDSQRCSDTVDDADEPPQPPHFAPSSVYAPRSEGTALGLQQGDVHKLVTAALKDVPGIPRGE